MKHSHIDQYDDEANLDLIDDEEEEQSPLFDESEDNEDEESSIKKDDYDAYEMMITQDLSVEEEEAFQEAKLSSYTDELDEYEEEKKTPEEIREEERLARYGLVVNNNGHYVDKAEFYRHMCMYCEARDKALAEGKEKPRPDDYIGLCITKIATHIAQRPNFYGYTYKEEFIGDSIEACIKYIDNFDPKKSNNPFCYFTTICMYCFLGRIKQEKKQSIIKGALMMQSIPDEFMTVDNGDNYSIDETAKNHHTFVELAYEQKKKDEASAEEKRIAREKRKAEKAAKRSSLDFLF